MRKSFGPVLRLLFWRLAQRLHADPNTLQMIRTTARDHSIVYVLPHASLMDYLLMNALALQQDLPLASFANDIPMLLFQPPRVALPALWARLHTLFHKPSIQAREECRHFSECLAAGEPVLIFLNRRQWFKRPVKWNVLIWEELLRTHRKSQKPVALIPVTFIWGRRPGRLHRTFLDILLGDTESPGVFRKAIIMLRSLGHGTLRIGTPIELSRFVSEVSPTKDELIAKKLRRVLSSYLFRERKLLVGPTIRSRRRVIRKILQDPELVKLVPSIARREKKTEKEIWAKAENILNDMIADYSPTLVAISYRVFLWLWGKLFNTLHVDEAGLRQLKSVCRDYPVIVIPSHRSHMDYIILSAIFYENDMMPPHIAGGINLSFWPMGMIFRKNGAYFIRRRMSGDLLYARLLGQYIRWLVRTGYTQEFYIEGQRSRTGKFVHPKHGLLSMQVDAFISSSVKDLYIVPINITYQKILEQNSYQAELSGKQKQKENFLALFRARKLLRQKHGEVFVRFSQPISVRHYLGLDQADSIPLKTKKERVMQLAVDVIRDISAQTVVTETALLATAILSSHQSQATKAALQARARIFAAYFTRNQFPCAPGIKNIDQRFPDILSFFERHRWLSQIPNGSDNTVYGVPTDQRLALDYYKNTVLYYLLRPAITALARKQSKDEMSMKENLAFLSTIFDHEFLFNKKGEAWLESETSPDARQLFAGAIMNYLEAYDLAARMVFREGVRFPPSQDQVRSALDAGKELLSTGTMIHREAISSVNFQSAIEFFHQNGLLTNPTALGEWHLQLKRLLGM